MLHKNEDIERTKYSLAATFLGRMCLSGEIDELRPDQEEALMKAVSFYNKAADILINGRSMEYGNRSNSLRKPDGTQVIVRKTDKEMLVVCHSFNNPSDDILIPLDNAYYVADDYYSGHISIADKAVVVKRMNPFNAEAVILRKTD